ncbi:class I SAM-dependent methyltransferase [Chitinophaga arvensicola]|uniref:Leucine carboxyl methyltransferase n=1 Tax=Chitinophaga arvensicola TaxID=29529 RepID=A0A1I0RE56_9BACT|nr:class I SAM-dependent methyltransferase [Chitinophaga arvensicola]SEW39164.1 Leucine carboxyl methyltransferase [Chitinophaga arvensicola]
MEITNRDYSAISPTAKSLLLLKGVTNIPYAAAAAKLILAPKPYQPELYNKDLAFWVRLLHFEDRYHSIDQLLLDLPVKNILELSSGFSFRGLATVQQPGYHYIDTDLPEVIATKQSFVTAFQQEPAAGVLEVLPLNALDEAAFRERIGHFPEGPVAIVNEGLLMYLDETEKEKLCGIIRRILQQRGGYWITGDIYIKREEATNEIRKDEQWKAFYAQHQIHEKMFDSFESAELFFQKMGFAIDKASVRDHEKLTALPHLLEMATPAQLQKMRQTGKIRTTWRLMLAE